MPTNNTTANSTLAARARREKQEADWKLLSDALERDVTQRVPKYADSVRRRLREDVQPTVRAYFENVESIQTPGRYTPEGERKEWQLAGLAVQEKLASLRKSTIEKLDADIDEKRKATLLRTTKS